jgi:hypothetical protein
MKRNFKLLIVLANLFIFLFNLSVYAKNVDLKKAIRQSKSWLETIDNSKYKESWNNSSPAFKKAVSEQQWISSMAQNRKPLGKVINRILKNKKHTDQIPGFSKGDFLVVQYQTKFESRESAIETVTMHLENSGEWRALGYYIK